MPINDYKEVKIKGVFIKHDFNQIIVSEDEVSKYTHGALQVSTMSQQLMVPYEYDI